MKLTFLQNAHKSISYILTFPAAWCAVFGLAVIDRVWLHFSIVHLPTPWIAFIFLPLVAYLKVIELCLETARISPQSGYRKFFDYIILSVEYFALCWAGGLTLCIMDYLFCSLDYPLFDAQFNAFDHLIGFDWFSMYQWLKPGALYVILHLAYATMVAQLLFFLLWFAAFRNIQRLYEIFWMFLLAMLLTTIIPGFMPALGPASFLGLQDVYTHTHPFYEMANRDVLAIRAAAENGEAIMRTQLNGIVTFPSFHTVCAILYIYGFRQTGWVGYTVLGVNILMLIATPVFGDHYLVDVLAGAIVALIAIISVHTIQNFLQRRLLIGVK